MAHIGEGTNHTGHFSCCVISGCFILRLPSLFTITFYHTVIFINQACRSQALKDNEPHSGTTNKNVETLIRQLLFGMQLLGQSDHLHININVSSQKSQLHFWTELSRKVIRAVCQTRKSNKLPWRAFLCFYIEAWGMSAPEWLLPSWPLPEHSGCLSNMSWSLRKQTCLGQTKIRFVISN